VSIANITASLAVSARRGFATDVTSTTPPPIIGGGVFIGGDVRDRVQDDPPGSISYGLSRSASLTVSAEGADVGIGWDLFSSPLSVDLPLNSSSQPCVLLSKCTSGAPEQPDATNASVPRLTGNVIRARQ
jgi:hypothetical protein